uniref:Uncharacterized protein n=1 Tax=Anguilla anguilla TaxID=7936 RepID=A0A0E9Q0D1_ANGAN
MFQNIIKLHRDIKYLSCHIKEYAH